MFSFSGQKVALGTAGKRVSSTLETAGLQYGSSLWSVSSGVI